MNNSILKEYWESREVIRYQSAQSGNADLTIRLAWQDVIRRHIGVGRNLRVLDVGSGCGILPSVFYSMKHRCTAVDQSSGLLEVAQQRATERRERTVFVQAECSTLDFPNAEFAAVVAVNVFSHLANPRDALAAWAKVLKPGGKLVIVEDDHLSADFPIFDKQRQREINSPLQGAYLQVQETVPFWQAGPHEIASFLENEGWLDTETAAPKGQLLRKGRSGLGSYEVGYQLVSATKAGSISI